MPRYFKSALDMGSQLIQSLLDPAAATDAVTKRYADGVDIPSGFSYQNIPLLHIGQTARTTVNGGIALSALWLPKGFVVSKLAVMVVGAATNPTHQWLTFHDSSRVMLAVTADGTSAAIGANALYSKNVATIASGASATYTTTAAGRFYVGCCFTTSTTQPTVLATLGNSSQLNTLADLAWCGGASTTGQTTPPAFPFTAGAPTAISGIPWVAVG